MRQVKKLTIGIFFICGTLFSPLIFILPTSALSDAQIGAISTNCNSIKQSLNRLASSDASTRIYLGTAYESLLTNFISPLNVRLAKNNLPNPELSNVQVNFSATRSNFIANYTTYMKQLENLINIDCKNSPKDFYAALEKTRTARANLQSSALNLNSIAHQHISVVTDIKDSL